MLNEAFSGLSLELIQNHFKNQDRDHRGRRHSDEAKKIELPLNFYSPKGYQYVRTLLSLPHINSLSNWTSSVKCEPGLFNVFLNLQKKIDVAPGHSDCVLICDGVSIK